MAEITGKRNPQSLEVRNEEEIQKQETKRNSHCKDVC